ncbi:MAG: polysaccharide biosynthesis/export family protein [Candidatus Margulisiibacteriota bacterium]
MKKLISIVLIAILHLTCLPVGRHLSFCTPSFAEAYKLSAYDTIELEIVNHPELKTKQTITPDGQASLPMLGVISVEGQTLNGLQKLLTSSYSAYIDNPQLVINLTPKPIYVVQYDLKKDTWEVKMARSVDEARAYADIDPTLTVEHGNLYRVTMSKKPDFFEDNWYKIITATAVMVGIYSTVSR